MAKPPPSKDEMHYDAMAQDALRGVVKMALKRAASPQGLPGDHHFYITFRTQAPGVSGPPEILAKYPDEMTIVLQHQYWDLVIGAESFEVTVSFNKQQERIKVPFGALSAFVDPSVRFGLQFDRKDKPGAGEKAEPGANQPASSLPAPEKRPSLGAPPEAAAKPEAAAGADAKAEDPASKIVKLDSFRKK